MKIINLSSYEKLKIRPVSASDIRIPFSKKNLKELWVDPKTISISDIMPGYMVKTGHEIHKNGVPNVWIFFDYQHLMEFYKKFDYIIDYINESECEGGFLRSNIDFQTSFMSTEFFLYSWPKNRNRNDMTITDVWKTKIDLDEICSLDSLLAFYKKYNLYDL